MMVYRSLYKILAWVFFGIGVAFMVAGVIAVAVSGIPLVDFTLETDTEIVALIMGIMAAVMLLPAVIFAGMYVTYGRRIENLRSGGMKVDAIIDEVRPLFGYSYDSSCPFIIVCRWEHEGMVYIYRSEYISFNPTKYFADHDIKTMPIYVDRYNPKRYYMDINVLTRNVVLA
ncbi:MAG: hypothetical protein LBS11_03655 [Oscillospiraceae bacterium]|nr:hypothetical protein [Oscillospiraceae bacterium]